jgi:hypothetical protein
VLGLPEREPILDTRQSPAVRGVGGFLDEGVREGHQCQAPGLDWHSPSLALIVAGPVVRIAPGEGLPARFGLGYGAEAFTATGPSRRQACQLALLRAMAAADAAAVTPDWDVQLAVLLVVLLVAQELADVRAFGGEEPWAG